MNVEPVIGNPRKSEQRTVEAFTLSTTITSLPRRVWSLAIGFPGLHALNMVLAIGYTLVQTLIFARVLDAQLFSQTVAATAVALYTVPLNQSVARANFVLLRERAVRKLGSQGMPEASAAFYGNQIILGIVPLVIPPLIGATGWSSYCSLACYLFFCTYSNIWVTEIQMTMLATGRALRFEYVNTFRRRLIFLTVGWLMIQRDFLLFNVVAALQTAAFHIYGLHRIAGDFPAIFLAARAAVAGGACASASPVGIAAGNVRRVAHAEWAVCCVHPAVRYRARAGRYRCRAEAGARGGVDHPQSDRDRAAARVACGVQRERRAGTAGGPDGAARGRRRSRRARSRRHAGGAFGLYRFAWAEQHRAAGRGHPCGVGHPGGGRLHHRGQPDRPYRRRALDPALHRRAGRRGSGLPRRHAGLSAHLAAGTLGVRAGHDRDLRRVALAAESPGLAAERGMMRAAERGMMRAAERGMMRVAERGMMRVAERGMMRAAERGMMRHTAGAAPPKRGPGQEKQLGMRVALIDPSLFTVPYDRALAGGLAEAGHDVTLYGRRPGPDDPDPAGMTVVPSFYRFTSSRPIALLPRQVQLGIKGVDHIASMIGLALRLRARRPDIVHFQWLPLPSLDHRLLSGFTGLAPLVLTIHDTEPSNGDPLGGLRQRGFYESLAIFDMLIVHTEQGRSRLLAKGIAEQRITVLPHGLLEDIAMPPATADLMQGELTFLLFGKIKPYKGLDILIEAFAQVPAELRAQARIRVVGKP